MNRRTTPIATAIVAATTLLLTACGGGSDSDDDIKGADKDKSSSPTSSVPSPTASTKVRDFGLPDDIKVDIAAAKTGDKGKDEILAGQAEVLMARQRLFVDLDPHSKYLNVYFTGQAKKFYAQQVKDSKKRGKTIAGTYRYYDRKVTQHTSDLAYVSYCEDQTKAFPKDIKTKKVESTTPSSKDYTLYNVVMRKSPGGVWQLQSLGGQSSARECQ
ncbi:hypothetical protein [Streptomyces sp. NPDC059009]|uniref:hypothetical protein n=1 Tax=Streptomyces sp. NPDC059009 TaxID=3346694 RepID=UPI0036CF4C75